MKIHMVNVEPGIVALGFRKMAAVVKSLPVESQSFYVPLTHQYSLKNLLLTKQKELDFQPYVARIAAEIADADIVAFSSMSNYADLVCALIAAVRQINPSAYVVWGGVHPIIVPEDAIQAADAICVGEGELAFAEFFHAFARGQAFRGTLNFWFRDGAEVIRNGFRPLTTGEEMDRLPPLQYADGTELIFDNTRGFVPLNRDRYLAFNGLGYHTIWSVGCPFRCTYCGNTRFIENDPGYRKIRHPSVDTIITEIKRAVAAHPHLDTIIFQDDSFLALPTRTLAAFAARWKAEIGLPFAVMGVIPNYVKREKIALLVEAGMNRVRMGIQSGSQRILAFYRRPSPPERIHRAATILGEFSDYCIPPAFDIIADNPLETADDIRETLRLIHALPRPFTLNLFSLRLMPNTDMATQFEALGIRPEDMAEGYHNLAPTAANALLYLLATLRPPQALFEWWLEHCQPFNEPQRLFPTLHLLLRAAYLSRRGVNHLRHMDFSLIPGKTGFLLKRSALIDAWRRRMVPSYRVSPVQPS